MKYLPIFFLALNLTACIKSAEQKSYEEEEAKNLAFRDKAISNFLNPPPRVEEPVRESIVRIDYSKDMVEPSFSGSYADKDGRPELIGKEILELRRKPIEDTAIYERLIRVQDNFKDITNKEKPMSLSGKILPNPMDFYTEILLDSQEGKYYLGLFRLASPEISHRLPYKRPAESRGRIVWLSNLSPSEKLFADAAEGRLYIQQIVYIPDLYRGHMGGGNYLYEDYEGKIKLDIKPITNTQTGDVAYKVIHPENGKPFYMARGMMLSDDYTFNIEHKGVLRWPYYNIDAVWQALIPDDPVTDD